MIRLTIKKRLQGAAGDMLLDVAFSVAPSSVTALMGASGAGKTSILKMIAGLMRPDEGVIAVHEQTWFDSQQRISRSVRQRSLGFVFQEYALFPNMTVRQNLVYALPRKASQSMVDEMLAIMQLQHLQHQKPAQLSGGQQQRVALARALVRQPRLLLLDEPFAALDPPMRLQLQQDLLRLLQRYHTTTLLVSHDVAEIARIADQVVVLDHGKVVQSGVPGKVLPAMQNNYLEGEVVAVHDHTVTLALSHVLGQITLPAPVGVPLRKGSYIKVHIRDAGLEGTSEPS